MPRKRKNIAESVVVESSASVTVCETSTVVTDADGDRDGDLDMEPDSEPTELNRLISEEEYSNGKAEVVVMNHTPLTSSPSSSNGRQQNHCQPSYSLTVDEDIDKISSEESPEPRAPEGEDDDIVDESVRLTNEDNDEAKPVTGQPAHSGEYTKIMEMLKEAEKEADPEYAESKARMEYLLKYNPRHPDSDLGIMDYCCAMFQCFALCIEG